MISSTDYAQKSPWTLNHETTAVGTHEIAAIEEEDIEMISFIKLKRNCCKFSDHKTIADHGTTTVETIEDATF